MPLGEPARREARRLLAQLVPRRPARPDARQSTDDEPLLTCDLCSQHSRTTCVPSLVGGEVIGSVLVAHERPLSASERGRIDQSVSQAAPVLANLRNLAVAEVRAATDALTGLPNARSLRENLVRMVAQAARSNLPLSAVLCDLDHFKQINDVFGHEKGDQALAAASAALSVGAPRERSRRPLRRRGVPDPAPGHAARGRRRPRGEAPRRGRARQRPRRRPRDHGQLRRRLLPRGHAGRGHARADGRPRALCREGAWTELRRHVRRAAGRVRGS